MFEVVSRNSHCQKRQRELESLGCIARTHVYFSGLAVLVLFLCPSTFAQSPEEGNFGVSASDLSYIPRKTEELWDRRIQAPRTTYWRLRLLLEKRKLSLAF